MRNMSFALTSDQVLAQSKDVTRRLGWLMLKPGDYVQPVRKCMGLRPGEKIERLGPAIRVVSLKRERLVTITEVAYGAEECAREGFPHLTPAEFVLMFCGSHKGCQPSTIVTRIEFTYCPEPA